ncbi:MAG TPA: hypothetical protein PLU58_07330 [Saprospiraceae bacterium]|nr:hypothetical protein [Saprospiraceae bacterium]
MTPILLFLLLHNPFTVLTFETECMITIAVYRTTEIDSVNMHLKDAALPVWINYIEK